MNFFTLLNRLLVIQLFCSLLYGAYGQTLPLRYTDVYRGNFILIGSPVGQEAAAGTPTPLTGTVGATGANTADSSPDVFWRSDSPSAGQAEANTSITAANARTAAQLNIPVGAVVKKAYLVWAGTLSAPPTGPFSVSIQYGNSTNNGLISDYHVTGPNNSYQAIKDITAIVQAEGSGTYTVSGVPCIALANLNNSNLFGGWSMVVFYESSSEPYRVLSLNAGLQGVSSATPYSATYSDLGVINGTVRLGIVAYEGDNTGVGDALSVNGTIQTNDLNPANNFFNGTRSTDGVAASVVGDLPRLTGTAGSMSGIDLDIIDITGSVTQGANSFTVAATSVGDVFFLGVLASSTEAILPTPTIGSFAATPDPVCSGSPVTFTATIGNVTGAYDFTLTNGSSTTTGTTSTTVLSQVLTTSGSGSQNFTLTVSDNGQSASATANVTVNNSATAVLSNNGPLSCTLTNVTLTASGGTSFTFVNSNGTVLAGSGNTRTVTTPGTYSVTVTNASGCISTTSTTVTSLTANVLVSNPTTTTAVQGVNFFQSFTASGGSSPYSYSLISGILPTGLSLSSTTGTLSGTATENSSYSITVQATDANGCVGTSAVYNLVVHEIIPIRYVRAGASGSGTSWANASGDVQAMINAVGVEQVWVAAGTYKPTATAVRNISFSMKNGVAIYGGFPASGNPTLAERQPTSYSTILSGDIDNDGALTNNSYHVISNPIGLTTGVLDGFIITGGNANAGSEPSIDGGGMFNNGAGGVCNPIVRNCLFLNNFASNRGGAVYNYARSNSSISSPQFINCSFMNNSSANGGGAIWNAGNAFNASSSPQFINCSFVANISTSIGGAITNDGFDRGNANPQLTNCSFLNNSAAQGGAIWSQGSYSSFPGNSNTQLTNCVFFNNGGSNSIHNSPGNATVTGTYSLFEPDVTGYVSGPGNLTTTVSPFVSTTNTQLNACSPAINTGSTSAYTAVSAPSTDLAGNPRFYQNGLIDMGAYELQVPSASLGITQQPPSGTAICAGATVTVTISVSGSSPTYQWYKDGISLGATQQSATLTLPNVTTAQAGSYSVIVANSCSSVTSTAFSLSVNPLPTPSLVASGTITCTQTSVTLTAGGGSSYLFSGSGIVNQNPTSGTALVNAGGLYSLTVTSASGCSSSSTLTVDQNTTLPVVSISPASTTLTCSSPSVSLSATGSGTYRWNTGAITQTIAVSTATTYSVTLTGTNGCTASASVVVGQDNAAPTVSISPSSATLTCTSPIVSLSAVGSGTYRWNTGATTSSISVSVADTYSVTLTGANGCTSTTSASISIDQTPPSLTISPASATLTCTNPVVSLSAIGTGNYRWSTGAATPVISTSIADTYSVTLTGANGCSVSASAQVILDQTPPLVSINPTSATLTCVTPVVSLSAVGSGTYRWSTGATTSTISATTGGSYSVTLTATNGCTASASTSISLDNTPPTVGIIPSVGTPTGATLTCSTTSISLSAVGSGSGTYHWNTGATTSLISVTNAGTYSVTLTGANSCTAVSSTTITLNNTPPSLTVSPSSATLTCTNPTVSLSAIGTGSLRWNTGATTSSISVSVAGTYSVTLTGANGCTSTANTNVIYQNCAPTLINNIPSQSAVAANVFSYTISPNTFTDAETPNSLTLTVSGLPAGLSFVSPNTITGIPSTTVGSPFTVTVVATDPGGLSASTSFLLNVQQRSFDITGVTMLDCNHISYFERRINFTVSFETTYGQPISLSVVNEARTVAINEPYQLTVYTDNPVIVFKASQQGTLGEATFSYNWLAFCANGNPRVENSIPPQSATVGQAFSYTIPSNTFTDAETPNSLSLSVVGLPQGLSFVAPATVTGTVSASTSAFYSVTITATDPAGGSVSTILPLSVVNPGGCGSMFTLKAGDWNNASVWSCDRVPLITDVVTLNHAVSLPATYQAQAMRVIYGATGRLLFGASSRLRLGAN
ncbi:putative Ig domain-containing protein [Spirosoma sp. BT702]|uniref:Ig domain-containing protein n=1 Tax=Spirosoma profusum TaxID=2771354 RepID=A0A927AU09_9BACT|nr:putative Ig domain-containing protein [Spirosoma profusum]MBD2701847.1 putative Ig domain-containing protein [Spirosoma profusum]